MNIAGCIGFFSKDWAEFYVKRYLKGYHNFKNLKIVKNYLIKEEK